MKKQLAILWLLACLAVSATAFAKPDSDKPQVSDAVLRNLTEDEQNRQLTEIRRSLANIERKLDRSEDQIQKLDHDLKELKRKV